MKADLPNDFGEPCRKAFLETRKVLAEADGLLTHNRIFADRMNGTGVISAEDAASYGITGPFLRATGADYDVRKDCPYAVYDRLTFDVQVLEGDLKGADGAASVFIDIIGLPFTPLSVAGVARRAARRAAWYGAAVHHYPPPPYYPPPAYYPPPRPTLY